MQRLAPITKYGAERVVTSPLPPNEILNLIYSACGCDYSLASITQEILIYLATYIETQPSLFVQVKGSFLVSQFHSLPQIPKKFNEICY